MIDLEKENRKVRCFLVGEPGNNLSELEGLSQTLGLCTAGKLTLSRLEIKPAYGMGKGKAEEISKLSKETESDCIIFDFNLEPTKQRNWEKLSGIPCFDRQELIIKIFAQRARTKEASLQVELARLSYSLSRLSHSYGDMARQRGGSYGSKGQGETQLELDQRQIRERISQVKKELEKVASTRITQRKKRSRNPFVECALVGYTNAGKSSLMNALTGSSALVEDKLFATLDPLTRKLELADGKKILLTDTVGFVSNLPHSLIDAFKSTLSSATEADILLVVIDCSDPNFEFQYSTVKKVLGEIASSQKQKIPSSAKNNMFSTAEKNSVFDTQLESDPDSKSPAKKSIIVLNKYDLCKDDDVRKAQLSLMFPEGIFVSAKTGHGLSELLKKISFFATKEHKKENPHENV